MKQREWILSVKITDPDGAEIEAKFAYDSMDKLLNFKKEHTGTDIIRKLAKMMLDSTTPDPEAQP